MLWWHFSVLFGLVQGGCVGAKNILFFLSPREERKEADIALFFLRATLLPVCFVGKMKAQPMESRNY